MGDALAGEQNGDVMELSEINEADMALLKQTGLDFNLCGPRILRDLGDKLLFEQPTALTPHAEMLVALIAAVRRDERERCAKLCEEMVLYTGLDCADAIRNQPDPL